jgi:hypothetical protein
MDQREFLTLWDKVIKNPCDDKSCDALLNGVSSLFLQVDQLKAAVGDIMQQHNEKSRMLEAVLL